MKIAYINADPEVPVFGTQGCSVHVQEMLLAMLKRGDEVHLFTMRIGDEAPPDVTELQIHPLPKLPKDDLITHERAALASNESLRDALSREAAQAPFDFVYERYSLWSCAAMDYAREHNVPAVLEINAPLIEDHMSRRLLHNRAAAEDVAMRAFRSANVITAVSRELAAVLEHHPTARGKVHVVPNTVNPHRFTTAARALPQSDAFVIGFVGTLKAWHGLTMLIDSFGRVAHELPHARLLVVGDGPEREQMDRELGARELSDRVHFTGAVAPERVPGYLASMDVAVAPYPALARFYFSPLKVYEYMAAGLPIVASRIGQIAEVIDDGITGRLVAPGDAAAMAQVLIELEQNPALRMEFGHAARAALEGHTWDDALAYILSLVANSAEPVLRPA